MAIDNKSKSTILNKSSFFSFKNIFSEQSMRELCSLSVDEILSKLESSKNGLSQDEADDRLKQYGLNILAAKKRYNVLFDILNRFRHPLVILLLIIIAVSFVMYLNDTEAADKLNDLTSTIVVGGMVILSVFLAFFQEFSSNKAVEKLKLLVQNKIDVLRDGKEVEIPISEVVPGDIVIFAAGSIIPADVRIIQTKDFFVSQSSLTGESLPIEKIADACIDDKSEVLNLKNACFQGSNVISGTAKAIVISTGINTFLGVISLKLTTQRETTNFDKGIKSFVWLMIKFMIIMVSAVFLIVGITKHNWLEAFIFGVSVAVGLTPEMLPMINTVCLAKGAIAMSKKKVIVKKLNSIQNFGAINVLCTDKTGTLTQDHVILEKYVDITNRDSEDVLRYAYMNSYYQTGLKNLLDLSILSHEELDVERAAPKIDEIPFDFVRKRMSVIIDYEERHVLICKGAVEEIYQVCDKYQIDDDIYPLIDIIRRDLVEEYNELSNDGYRVIAIAYKEFDKDKTVFSSADEEGLVLLGYLAFLDPPKDSSAKAIKALNDYGVNIKVLTGDNELVTKKICKDVGLNTSQLTTGPELLNMSDEEFRKTVKEKQIFARLNPFQKEQIILSLKDQGFVVGFLGDGINDSLALKASDVGISVDTAVDVAKESADIILLEKNLLVLEDGIIEGRKVFANIIKYIKMGASSNFGNMFSVVGGSYFLPFLPMTPLQVLTNNLLYDMSQTGIPNDNVDDEFIVKPQNWDIGFIKRFMIFIGPISSIFDYATYFLMLYFFNCILFKQINTPVELKTYYEQLFHTGWFVESILTQTLIVHIIRTNKIPFFQSRASFALTTTTLFIMFVGGILPYTPVAKYIGLVPLPFIYWIWIAGFLLTYSILTHNVKIWFNKRFGGK